MKISRVVLAGVLFMLVGMGLDQLSTALVLHNVPGAVEQNQILTAPDGVFRYVRAAIMEINMFLVLFGISAGIKLGTKSSFLSAIPYYGWGIYLFLRPVADNFLYFFTYLSFKAGH